MKKKTVILAAAALTLMLLAACTQSGGQGAGQSAENSDKLVYGVECVILRCPGDTYFITEIPQVNDEKEWSGLNPPLRSRWVKAGHGEVAGNILNDVAGDYEFLDAKVSVRVPEDGGDPVIDDLWDDEKISADEVKALGLFEESRCKDISGYEEHWKTDK